MEIYTKFINSCLPEYSGGGCAQDRLAGHNFELLGFRWHVNILTFLFVQEKLDQIKDLFQMERRSISEESLKELIDNVDLKETYLRSLPDTTFQEQQLTNLLANQKYTLQFFASLIQQQTPLNPPLTRLLLQHNNIRNCLLGHCFANQELFQQKQPITISHHQSNSQAALLALFLAKLGKRKVTLLTEDHQLRRVGRLIAESSQTDRIGYTKQILKQEGIQMLEISSWNISQFTFDNQFVVIDLFGLNPTQYRAFLLRNSNAISNSLSTIIYHSHLQDSQVMQQLASIYPSLDWTSLQISAQYSPETYVNENQQAMLARLRAYLRQNRDSSDKSDVAIFFPVNYTSKAYSAILKESLSKDQLRQQTNLILGPLQSQLKNKNNIFLVTSSAQLFEWDYDYTRLVYIVDYSTQLTFSFDYGLGTRVKTMGLCTGEQKAKRMSVGTYRNMACYSCLSLNFEANPHYLERTQDLSWYVLKAIAWGVDQALECWSPRLLTCLQLMESLKICEKQEQRYYLLDKRLIAIAQDGINPIEAKIILNILDDSSMNIKNKQRFANLMAIGLGVLVSGVNLHQQTALAQALNRKYCNFFWKDSGYLEQALKIFIKCDCIQLKNAALKNLEPQAEMFRRISSRVSEDEESAFFGSLYQLCETSPQPPNKQGIPFFLQYNEIDQNSYHIVENKIEHLREVLAIKPTEIILQSQDVQMVLDKMVSTFPQAIAYYTGHKRIGYKFQKQSRIARLLPNSLMAKTGQFAECLYVLGLVCHNGQLAIEFANPIGSQLALSLLGKIPIKSTQSHGETQIQFHGVSNAIFAELVKSNQELIRKVEEQHECIIELKEQIALITIYCSKQSANKLKDRFQELMGKIREDLRAQRRVISYQKRTRVVMRTGGEVEDIICDKYVNKCLVSNIHPDVTKEDLLDLFSEFVSFRELVLYEPEEGNHLKTATIHFYSQKDYELFHQCFNRCVLFELPLQVKPVYKNQQFTNIGPQKYIQFKWFVWTSSRRALVQFIDTSSVLKAIEGFKNNPLLDGAQVVVASQQNSLILENLNGQTDEIYIQSAMKGYGLIKTVELLRYPIREQTHPDQYLERLIYKVTQPNQQEESPFRLEEVKRLINGQRYCRAHFVDGEALMKVVAEYNLKPGVLGEGRLYAKPVFEKTVFIPEGLKTIYVEILQQTLKDQLLESISFKLERERSFQYVILIGPYLQVVEKAYNSYLKMLKPSQVKLSKVMKSMLFNDIALSNLLYLQQKYRCKLLFNHTDKKVSILATSVVADHVKNQIKDKIANSFFYYVRLNSLSYKHLQAHPQIVKHLQDNFKLTTAELQKDNYSLLVKGSVEKVEQAAAELMHMAQSLHPTMQQMNPNICGICCNKFTKPYRLQVCSHLFCLQCLQSYFKAILNDMSLFPVKCPQCCQGVSLMDLESCLTKAEWQKLKTMGVNKYVGLNSEKVRFCYTVGCKQINFLKGPTWNCDTCKISYCNNCKEPAHPGIKCEDVLEIRQSDEYFKKYMVETGGRFCAKESCKMPVVRIDGCFKVQCTRCNTCMCFKCPPDKMTPYENSNECYAHLNNVHGGYF